jgi:hypothetical protein
VDQANGIQLLFFLTQLVADLAAPTTDGSRLAAMHALSGSKSLQTLRGPWSGAQASMALAYFLAGYSGSTAGALLAGDEGLATSAVSVWLVFVRQILG